MRRLSALVAATLVAAPIIAVAQPEGHWEHRRYHPNQWVALASPATLDHRMVRIEANDARVHAIELQAVRGGANIIDIGVIYSDRTQEAFQIYRPLDARTAPNLRVDLGGRGMNGVHAIVVEGEGRVAFRVIGAR